MKILRQGAEAVIYSDVLDGVDVIVKERIPKRYRIKQIDDRLRLARMRQEMKLIRDARGIGVMTPKIISSDESSCKIFLEELSGDLVKDAVSRKKFDWNIFFEMGAVSRGTGQSFQLLH